MYITITESDGSPGGKGGGIFGKRAQVVELVFYRAEPKGKPKGRIFPGRWTSLEKRHKSKTTCKSTNKTGHEERDTERVTERKREREILTHGKAMFPRRPY